MGSGSLRVGDDAGISVTARYEAPFAFSGTLDRVTIDLLGPDRHDATRDLDDVMPSQ